MRIAVISDTHLYDPSPWLEAVYDRWLAPADVLLHCGDTTGMSLWSWFMRHPRFHAVVGNMDDWPLAQELDSVVRLDFDGLKVAMAHGHGFGYGSLDEAVARELGPGFDLVCYGHTHKAKWVRHGGVAVLNPGSLRQGPGASLALVDVGPDKEFEVEFVSPNVRLGMP